MKNKPFFILVLFFTLCCSNVYAQEGCLKEGYTVVTINGIFTDNIEAKENKESLKKNLPPTYNNQKVSVDYIYNPTHLAGAGDLVDVIRQGLFDPKSDYDLVEMLDDASDKVDTQKLLIVGHSQGNFYANSFYNKVVDKDGGVPSESIGVYAVATPDKYVAGDGKYVTSDTDSVIAAVVGRLKNILKPNIHIDLEKIDGNGHSFSDVYLKYQSSRIVSDIESSLDKLKTNNTQDSQSLCISPQRITALHKVTGVVLAVADYAVNTGINAKSYVNTTVNKAATSLASSVLKLAKSSLALVGFSNDKKQLVTVSAEEQSEDVIQQPKPEVVIENTNQNDTSILPEVVTPPEAPKNNQENIPVILSGGYTSVNKNKPVEETPEVVPPVVDIILPVIKLTGDATVSVYLNTIYLDVGATASDSTGKVIPVTTTGTVDTSKIGSYLITYSAVDAANNLVAVVTRTVNVMEAPKGDTTPPVIKLTGDSIVFVELNGQYVESGATASDEKDGVVLVTNSGVVDTSNLGDYTITYTAVDDALNVGTLTRTVKVINSNPILSLTAKLEIPTSGIYKDDGLDPNVGKKDLTSFVFQVIYTDSANKSPQGIKMHVKDKVTGTYLPDVDLSVVPSGADILNDRDYTNGELYTISNKYDKGEYLYSFVSNDSNGNFSKIEEKDILKFSVVPSTYVYIPKYTFGTNNGDDRDWQVWSFNGSNVYDWGDLYVGKYLQEHFKIQAYVTGVRCTSCLLRGIFNHDPQKGFERADVYLTTLENNPQNNADGITYDVVIQWDSTGYTYTIFYGNLIYRTGHVAIENINSNTWVGWSGESNGLVGFPSGVWQSVVPHSPDGRTGGMNMIMIPFLVYNPGAIDSIPYPIPNQAPAPILSSGKMITSFSFDGLNPTVVGVIDNTNHSIVLTVPYGTDVKTLTPTIAISNKASIAPASSSLQDFTNPVVYTVKAEDNSIQAYTVTVLVGANPNPTPPPSSNVSDDTPAAITSYTLNGSQNNITLNPKTNNLTIVVNTNKNVEWKSIQIEKDDDAKVYKTLPSNATTCKHGTNRCERTWDGDLVRDLILQNVNYKIVVHFVDTLLNNDDYNEYLPSMITVVGQ